MPDRSSITDERVIPVTTNTVVKDPETKSTYGHDWQLWLNGDTISTSTWTVTANESPVTLVLSNSSIGAYTGDSPQLENSVTRIIADGGTAGITYTIVNHIVTDGGQECDRSITVKCWNR